ncbi:MAG: hypothetical protein M3Q23_16440 [Actinomycetota bacterium]|nr:hypothetical protein [Actinomycetota bacterium]
MPATIQPIPCFACAQLTETYRGCYVCHGQGKFGSRDEELRHLLWTKLVRARGTASPGEAREVIYHLPGGGQADEIWLVRNELDGWTVMFASDY